MCLVRWGLGTQSPASRRSRSRRCDAPPSRSPSSVPEAVCLRHPAPESSDKPRKDHYHDFTDMCSSSKKHASSSCQGSGQCKGADAQQRPRLPGSLPPGKPVSAGQADAEGQKNDKGGREERGSENAVHAVGDHTDEERNRGTDFQYTVWGGSL